jgi:hypothetical protein
MKTSNLIIVLFIFYIMLILSKKRNKSKCILEPMNNPKFDNFVEKQFETNILDPLRNVTFSPECCPSTYSSDSGCACMNDETRTLIQGRATNRDGCLGGYI